MNYRSKSDLSGRLVLPASRPQNKYRAIRTTVDGYTFASKREAERYMGLRQLQRVGEITDLKLQVPFELIPSVTICQKKMKPVTYIADFTYTENGKMVVEDCKGFITKEYRIKRKLMKHVHNIEVIET
jgi:hypothetical protein